MVKVDLKLLNIKQCFLTIFQEIVDFFFHIHNKQVESICILSIDRGKPLITRWQQLAF